MAVVYVIQEQLRWDERTQKLVPRFNLEPARQFGELKYLLPSTASPFYPREIIRVLKDKLAEVTFRDYLLLIGNPCLIGFATAVMSVRNSGVVNMLQWHTREKRYVVVQATDLNV